MSGLIHIHLGSHFWGSGNFGDDLMLAGFLHALHKYSVAYKLTCCCPFDLESQRLRFPEVEWLAYTDENRQTCIEECDVWLCLGGAPFQTVLSDWFLQHLAKELDFCEASNKETFFLGVGLNDDEALDHPITLRILASATHIWTRDALTARALRARNAQVKCSEGSDLSHLFLQHYYQTPTLNNKKVGLVLNFEEHLEQWNTLINEVIQKAGGLTHCYWIAQETRVLPGSELQHYVHFTQGCPSKSTLLHLDYKTCTIENFLNLYQSMSLLITSRYHSALISGWLGIKPVLMERNLKLKGLAQQWPVSLIGLNDTHCAHALEVASTVPCSLLFEARDRAYLAFKHWMEYL